MKYALLNEIKIEATKGFKGVCPNCGSELIAKCGDLKINHWAHKRTRTCDTWWEPETEWHRSWKNNYSNEWQEVILQDERTDEKHIADVCTAHNLIIEFQHSYIDSQERTSREKFYKNMVWIVDGTRLKRDYPRFLKGRKYFLNTEKKGLFLVDYPDEIFPTNWLGSSVPVIFDFKGIETTDDNNNNKNYLYCLLSIRVGRYIVLAEIPRQAFIKTTINGEWSSRIQNFESLNPKKERLQQQPKVQIRHREGTHYYDAKKGRMLKKWRF